MKIAIDASRAINEQAGIGRYSRELIRKLIEIDRRNNYFLLFNYWRRDRQKERLIGSFRGPNVKIKIWRLPGKFKEKIWKFKLPGIEKILDYPDVYLATTFLEAIEGLKVPQALIIHDMTTFLFPEYLGETLSGIYNLALAKAAQKVQKIITISKSSASDIGRILKIPAPKIKIIYPGNNDLGTPATTLPAGVSPQKYILAVGTIEPRKNLAGLFKAYSLLPVGLREQYPIVIAGAKGWNNAETFDILSKLHLEGRVKFLGYVSDAVLAKLYKEAAVFAYPSLYEGFGFPVLEALSYGAPVLTANISSLPEVAGSAALLCEPQSPKSISSGLQRLLEHKEEANRLRKLAKAQAAKFSWEKAAGETLKILEEIK